MHSYMRPVYDLLALTCMQYLPLRAHLHANSMHMLPHASVYRIPYTVYPYPDTPPLQQKADPPSGDCIILRRSVERLRHVVMRAGPGPGGLLAGAVSGCLEPWGWAGWARFSGLARRLRHSWLEGPRASWLWIGACRHLCARRPWEQTSSSQQTLRT